MKSFGSVRVRETKLDKVSGSSAPRLTDECKNAKFVSVRLVLRLTDKSPFLDVSCAAAGCSSHQCEQNSALCSACHSFTLLLAHNMHHSH